MERLKPENRIMLFELRSADTRPIIAGYAALFNEPTVIFDFREQIAPGAFADSIAVDDIRALIDHDPKLIIGRNKAQTLRLAEDEKGLAVEIEPPDTSFGRDLVTSMRRGDISQMSFSFGNTQDEWDTGEDGMPLRTILKAKLYDVSVVTFPAYENTEAALRSRQAWEASAAKASARRSFANIYRRIELKSKNIY